MAIAILAAPNLRTSYVKIAERLKGLDYDALFLNLPENLEPLVRDLVEKDYLMELLLKRSENESWCRSQ